MERLQFSFANSGAGATLADGGEMVADVSRECPPGEWEEVCAPFFLGE
jgi:hypothetical protein